MVYKKKAGNVAGTEIAVHVVAAQMQANSWASSSFPCPGAGDPVAGKWHRGYYSHTWSSSPKPINPVRHPDLWLRDSALMTLGYIRM